MLVDSENKRAETISFQLSCFVPHHKFWAGVKEKPLMQEYFFLVVNNFVIFEN